MGCPVPGQELDKMILVGPFPLRTFFDSVTIRDTQLSAQHHPSLGLKVTQLSSEYPGFFLGKQSPFSTKAGDIF